MFALRRRTFHRLGQRLATSSTRPFQILGLQQIAVGALDKEMLRILWQDTLGLSKVGNFVSAKENVDEDMLTLGKGLMAIEVDLMTPLDPEKSPKVSVSVS